MDPPSCSKEGEIALMPIGRKGERGVFSFMHDSSITSKKEGNALMLTGGGDGPSSRHDYSCHQ